MSYYPAMGAVYGGAPAYAPGYPPRRVDSHHGHPAAYAQWPAAAAAPQPPAQYPLAYPAHDNACYPPQYAPAASPLEAPDWAPASSEYRARAYAHTHTHHSLEHQLLVAHHLAKLSASNGANPASSAWPQPQPQPQPQLPSAAAIAAAATAAADKHWSHAVSHLPSALPAPGAVTALADAGACFVDPAVLHIGFHQTTAVPTASTSPPAVQREMPKSRSDRTRQAAPGDEGWSWEGRTSWLAPVVAALFLQLSEAFQDVDAAPTGPEHSLDWLSPASKQVVNMAPAPQPTSLQVATDQTYDDRVFLSLQQDSYARSAPSWAHVKRPEQTTRLTMETFTNFVQTVLQQPLLTPATLFLALFYALRLYRTLADIGSDEMEMDDEFAEEHDAALEAQAYLVQSWKQEFREAFLGPPTSLPFKLFVLGLMMANKHLDDNTFLNKTWTEVTGIPLAELNLMERFYLRVCHFDLVPKEDEWVCYLHDLSNSVSRRLIDSYNPPSPGEETIDKALEMNEVGPDQYRWVLVALEEQMPAEHAPALKPKRASSVVSYLSTGDMDLDSPLLAPVSPASEHSTVDSLNASPYRGFEAFSSPNQRMDDSTSSSASSPSIQEPDRTVAPQAPLSMGSEGKRPDAAWMGYNGYYPYAYPYQQQAPAQRFVPMYGHYHPSYRMAYPYAMPPVPIAGL